MQRYVDNPLLLDGLKFEVRVYLVLTGTTEMKGYIAKEGLAHFCT